MSAIIRIGPSDTMTVDMALSYAMDDELTDVVIAGYGKDGYLVVRSSRMTRAEAFWLLEQAKKHALETTK